MGLSIGQTAASVAAVRPATLVQPNRRGTAASSEGRAEAAEGSVTIGQPQSPVEERVLSVAGAALRILDTNFETVRRLVPSIRELNEENRVQRAEATRERAIASLERTEEVAALEEDGAARPVEGEQQNGAPVARVESLRPEPSAQVHNFVIEEGADPAAVSFVQRSDAPEGPAPQAPTPSRIDVLV